MYNHDPFNDIRAEQSDITQRKDENFTVPATKRPAVFRQDLYRRPGVFSSAETQDGDIDVAIAIGVVVPDPA